MKAHQSRSTRPKLEIASCRIPESWPRGEGPYLRSTKQVYKTEVGGSLKEPKQFRHLLRSGK